MTVEQIQCLLTYLGYNPGAVDGVNGLKTAAAVLVFQQQEGLRQDGVHFRFSYPLRRHIDDIIAGGGVV